MSIIGQLLVVEGILLNSKAASKKRALDELAQVFGAGLGLAPATIYDSLIAREQLGTTGLGLGTAIPHARVKGLLHPAAAFLRPEIAIEFDAPDGKPVAQILALLVPEEATDEHLKILAEIARMFCDRDFRDRLATAAEPAAIKRLFADWQP